MVEEGTLKLVRSSEPSGSISQAGPDSSKDELQHRMEAARDSISQTVDEIKDTMVNQYESVKDSVSKTLDWHEQVKRRPAVWSAGALGAGFVVGYGVAAVVKGPGRISVQRHEYLPARPSTVKPSPVSESNRGNGRRDEAEEDSRTGLIKRIKETPAYDRVRNEAGVIGNRFVDEISQKAQEVILPAAIAWLGSYFERLLPARENRTSKAN